MKQITATILLIAFTLHTFSGAVIFINFYVNQKYIAKNFCVNKASPQMNCHGKCQLSKKMAGEENKDKQNPERKNENRNEITSPVTFSAYNHINAFRYIIKTYPAFDDGKPIDRSPDIFHPPSA